MVPFRLKQQILPELRNRPAVKPFVEPNMPSKVEALQIFSWNASQSLQLDDWLSWCSSQPYTLVLVQETGWNLNRRWTAPGWYMIHSSAGRASTLCMVRTTLLRPDQLTFADVIPGRLQHIRLYLIRVHDIFNIYQVAWNTTKPRNVLLHERTLVWKSLQEAIKHVPKNHMLLIAGDCNTPLNIAPPAIESGDAKYSLAAQTDKHEFQSLVQEFDLCAPHCRGKWNPTFKHGTHPSRIDFMFIRAH